MLRNLQQKKNENQLNLEEEQISIKAVVDYIKQNLEDFSKKYSYINNEDGLTQSLSILLTHKAELFFFQCQYSEDITKGNSPRVDLAVFLKVDSYSDKSFLLIEAKRLDSSINKKREKEYVTGRAENNKYLDTGGIERFKKMIHGKSSQKYAAMIGYMQSDSFNVWLNKVNGWIDEQIIKPNSTELHWNEQDKLVKQNESGVWTEYKSSHSRLKASEIILIHLWVDCRLSKEWNL